MSFTVGNSSAAEKYKLHPGGAAGIVNKAAPLPTAERVEIYVSPAKWGVERAEPVPVMKRREARLVLEEKGEIARLESSAENGQQEIHLG